MEKQVLSIERMQHLQELGLDTSKTSMCWVIDCNHAGHLKIHDLFAYNTTNEKVITTFTLQDIFEMLPKEIINDEYNCLLTIFYNIHDNKWIVSYEDLDFSISNFCHETLIDAAYEMLCWCIENGHIKTK